MIGRKDDPAFLYVASNEAALRKLEGFRLDGIVQKMTCPFLLLHGAGDEQTCCGRVRRAG